MGGAIGFDLANPCGGWDGGPIGFEFANLVGGLGGLGVGGAIGIDLANPFGGWGGGPIGFEFANSVGGPDGLTERFGLWGYTADGRARSARIYPGGGVVVRGRCAAPARFVGVDLHRLAGQSALPGGGARGCRCDGKGSVG